MDKPVQLHLPRMQHRLHRRRSSAHRHRAPDQSHAMAVVRPRRRVPEIKRLDRRSVQPVPAVDRHSARRRRQSRRDHHGFLVPGHQRAEWVPRQRRIPLRPHCRVVLRKHRLRRHRLTRHDRRRRQFHQRRPPDRLHHFSRRQHEPQFIRDRLRRTRRQRREPVVRLRSDPHIVRRNRDHRIA